MSRQNTINTTFGELVSAVTEEVTALMGSSPFTYVVVSYNVSDLISQYRIREPKYSDRPLVKSN